MASVTAGSEEISERSCQPCGDDGERLPAEAYCTECQEYLCATCLTHHRKLRVTKHHVILDKSQMPKIKPASTAIDTCTESCVHHKGEIISFYCKSHDQLGCQRCAMTGHIGCELSKLSEATKGIAESPEYKEMMTKLNGLEQKYGRTLSLSNKHMEEIKTYHSRAIEGMEKMVTAFKNKDEATISSISNTSKAVIADIQTLTSKLETLKRTNQNSQMFVVMKNATHQIHTLEDSLNKIDAKNNINRYKFTSNWNSNSAERSPTVLGQLVIKPKHVKDVNVKSSTDTSDCVITGSCLLPNKQVVIADWNNRKVKLVNMMQNEVTSEIQLTSNVFDVTMIDNSNVATTVTNEKKIQFLSIMSSTLSKVKEIKTTASCRGIVHNDGTLIITSQSPCKVEMIDMNGTVLKSMTTDEKGTPLFSNPLFAAISPDRTTVYVSDTSKHAVTCMTMDGTVKAVYNDDNLKSPRGLAIDRTGAVYVCDHDSCNVRQITAECTTSNVLLGKEHGCINPSSVTLSENEDKLYVSMNSNNLRVFQIK